MGFVFDLLVLLTPPDNLKWFDIQIGMNYASAGAAFCLDAMGIDALSTTGHLALQASSSKSSSSAIAPAIAPAQNGLSWDHLLKLLEINRIVWK